MNRKFEIRGVCVTLEELQSPDFVPPMATYFMDDVEVTQEVFERENEACRLASLQPEPIPKKPSLWARIKAVFS